MLHKAIRAGVIGGRKVGRHLSEYGIAVASDSAAYARPLAAAGARGLGAVGRGAKAAWSKARMPARMRLAGRAIRNFDPDPDNIAKFANSHLGAGAIGAGVGAAYGAVSSEEGIIGGALKGAAVGAGGRALYRGARAGYAKGGLIGARTGAAGGAALGFVAGGPVGMAVGAGIGAGGGAVVKGFRALRGRIPQGAKTLARAGMYPAAFAGAAGLGAMPGAMSAASSMQYPRDTNLGATGDLTLGLHSLRHG